MSDGRSSEGKARVDGGAATAAVRQTEQPPSAREEENVFPDTATNVVVGPEDSRESRVDELRQQYLDGRYKVDAAKVSAKIVDKHLPK